MTTVYVALAVAMTTMVIASFWAIYVGPLRRGEADRPWLCHLHGAISMGWMALLVAQAALVSLGAPSSIAGSGRLASPTAWWGSSSASRSVLARPPCT
ncbi:MAG: hypothetical protein HYY76_00455 [Acidobacteria bacterium]|nr:hypothetical protein [Acidobacteriota bacterium]